MEVQQSRIPVVRLSGRVRNSEIFGAHKFGTMRVPGFRSLEIPKAGRASYWNPGFLEFMSTEIMDSQSPGVRDPGILGVHE